MGELPTTELDRAIRESLTSLHQEVAPDWYGKERELVSRFCFGHLVKYFGSVNQVLRDQAQMGMEVRVKQTSRGRTTLKTARKREVCKDIVIWPEPFMTLWNKNRKPVNVPLAVIEWKCIAFSSSSREDRQTIAKHDCEWLCDFTSENSGTVGFSVVADLIARPVFIRCDRFESGRALENWLTLG
jgi:hypothetical protein